MNHTIIAIIYAQGEFDDQYVLDAVRRTEEMFPVPHPHPEEKYFSSPLIDTYRAIFYELGRGGKNDSRDAIQLFREDGFASIIKKCTAEKRETFCYYLYISDERDDLTVICKYDQRRFDEYQQIDGLISHIFNDENGDVKTENLGHVTDLPGDADALSRFLQSETGLTPEAIRHAWYDRERTATLLAGFNCEQ